MGVIELPIFDFFLTENDHFCGEVTFGRDSNFEKIVLMRLQVASTSE